MTKLELKSILKPLMREVIKEVLLEENNVIKHLIKECMSAFSSKNIVFENNVVSPNNNNQIQNNKDFIQKKTEKQKEQKRRLLDAIGFSKALDPFEGTTLLGNNNTILKENIGNNSLAVPGPLNGLDPNDSGVDVTQLLGGFRKFKIK